MDIVAQKEVKGQEEERFQSIQDGLQDIEPEKFWEELGKIIREGIRLHWKKQYIMSSVSLSGHWNMREPQIAKMLGMATG